MNFRFETQGTNTHLSYTVDANDKIDSMSLGMLTNNKIPGIATTIFSQLDSTKFIKFNVSARVSVRQFFSGPVNKKRLIGVFTGIVNAMLSAEDYMIDPRSILLDLDYIFADVSTCDTVLICLPVYRDESESVNLGNFFKNIMFSTQFDQTENCDHVAQIINYLNSTPVFSLTDFKELLRVIKEDKGAKLEQPKYTAPQPTVPPQHATQPVQPVAPAPQSVVTRPVSPQVPTPQPQPIQPQPVIPNFVTPEKVEPVVPEKKMTMFELLRNYSKENAEIYKAQKEAEKAGSAERADKHSKAEKAQKSSKPEKESKKSKSASFQIPGDFTIPGSSADHSKPQPAPQTAPQQVAQPAPKVNPQPVSQPAVQQPVVQQPVVQQPVIQQPVVQQGGVSFGNTTVLNSGMIGETMVLNNMQQQQQYAPKPHLIRMKNSEDIPINKPVFRIGKERSYVDYFISDNTAISRSHANIVNRDGEYYIVDTNSTNHTFINSMMIESNVETKLISGDRIRLANEEFEFKIC